MDPLSSLPPECLRCILDTLSLENSASAFAALIQTSRYLATLALPYLYRDPYRFTSYGKPHSRPRKEPISARFFFTRDLTRVLLDSLPPSIILPKILSLALQPIDPSVLGCEESCTTISACEAADTPESPLLDYFAQIRHLHQKPWSIGYPPASVSKFILTQEYRDLCNRSNLLPILEQDLTRLKAGTGFYLRCYPILFFCEVNWALASPILE